MIPERKKQWIVYSTNMGRERLAKYFMINFYTACKFNSQGLPLAVIYDAFRNLKTVKERKEWLYALNPNKSVINNTFENWLDVVWEGYINRLDYEQKNKEEQYESGNIDWKLNKGFRS
jgi:hypothetical protein